MNAPHHPPPVRTQVDAAARQLYAEHGTRANTQAFENIMKADAEDKPDEAAFWQAVSRALLDPGVANSFFRF